MSVGGINPNDLGNMGEIEQQFAVKTVEHLETYQRVILNIPPSSLKLTKMDDAIMEDFQQTFPELDSVEALTKLNENEMKSPQGKERWRNFIMKYEKLVPDYNFGTILRGDAKREYDEDNSILVTRVQFYAIEIARNRKGVNDDLYNRYQAQQKNKA
ncbi:hypothetical protein FFLO_00352 [Filobasidium floriforme]|uniref:Polysaccharide biosynthesis domain-containing protein n=1 Tax=Filobasidium floriforme TaxID=5210 RepID=A0A8K0JS40_9TREE|nr:putative polysaccharide biosynthesis protein [Filobasidium floriforme]KAG7575362.1 hypothetical protein FFLO_00352 [Filobasidium floriforme]KAH8089549.1 putative polysaccharide biosynthesis protein [Filobasidium floriforme]